MISCSIFEICLIYFYRTNPIWRRHHLIVASVYSLSSLERFQAPRGWGPDKYDTVLIRVLDSNSGSILMEESSFLWRFPKAMPNIMRKVDVTLLSVKQQGLDNSTAEVTISSSGLALFVVLTTAAPGRFKENAFVLRPHQTKVR